MGLSNGASGTQPSRAQPALQPMAQLLVLSCCMRDLNAYHGLIQLGLNAGMFSGRYRELFEAIVRYRAEWNSHEVLVDNMKIEGFNLSELVRIQGCVYDQDVGSTALYAQYFEVLKAEYLKREATRIFNENRILDPPAINRITEGLTALVNSSVREGGGMKETIKEAIDEIEKRQAITFSNPYKLGLKTYDQLGHFESGSLIVLGGESGHGKSTLALNMVYRWLQNDMRIVYFSFEMTRKVIITKLNLIHKNLDWDRTWVTKGERLSDEEFTRLIDGFSWFVDKPLLINTRASSVQEMEVIVRNHRASVFILDTINALIGHEERQDIALGDVARRWKRIAEEIDGLGIVIAQLKDVTSRPSDKNLVKESRQIRDVADYMDFVYREEEKKLQDCTAALKGTMELYRVKGRLTGVGKEIIGYNQKTGIVWDLPSEEYNAAKNCRRGKKGREE